MRSEILLPEPLKSVTYLPFISVEREFDPTSNVAGINYTHSSMPCLMMFVSDLWPWPSYLTWLPSWRKLGRGGSYRLAKSEIHGFS